MFIAHALCEAPSPSNLARTKSLHRFGFGGALKHHCGETVNDLCHLDKDNAKQYDKFKFNSILCHPLLLFIFTIVFPPMNLMFMTTQIN